MHLLFLVVTILAILAGGFLAYRLWGFLHLFPSASTEVVQLTQEKRVALGRLRHESKFGPNNYPPLGYTGAPTEVDRLRASAAVDAVIDAVLAHPNGPIGAQTVTYLIGNAMHEVDLLDTEDRDRTSGYMLEIWYMLGFKGATGRFAYGAAFSKPAGYGEPLPPGWNAPDSPRPIG